MGIFRLTQSARECIYLFIVFEVWGGGGVMTLTRQPDVVFSRRKTLCIVTEEKRCLDL